MAVPSNPCVWPSSKINIFFLLSVCTHELLSTPKITTFLPQLKSGNKKSEPESNLIPYPQEEYLSGSEFLVNLSAPNKQPFRTRTKFK